MKNPFEILEVPLEYLIFRSRWLLAPIYLGLVGALIIVLIKFTQEFFEVAERALHTPSETVILDILGLLDLALMGNLILIVIFAGYENFVSKIDEAAESEDRPYWMGHVDFSGLKVKMIGSLVAISVIQLLQDFVHVEGAAEIDAGFKWRVVLHLTFVVSGVLFAVMDWIGDKRILMNKQFEAVEQASVND